MAISTFYETDTYVAYPDDNTNSKTKAIILSFVVQLIDDYTGEKPIGRTKVEIKEIKKRPSKECEGYYIFTNLVHGNHTVHIDSELYFPVKVIACFSEEAVDYTVCYTEFSSDPKSQGKSPIVRVILKPRPEYPFPAHATLVRGSIKASIKDLQISNAKMTVIDREVGKDLETMTDEKGNFVLYFCDVTNEEEVTIEIEKSGHKKSVKETIKEFKTVIKNYSIP